MGYISWWLLIKCGWYKKIKCSENEKGIKITITILSADTLGGYWEAYNIHFTSKKSSDDYGDRVWIKRTNNSKILFPNFGYGSNFETDLKIKFTISLSI